MKCTASSTWTNLPAPAAASCEPWPPVILLRCAKRPGHDLRFAQRHALVDGAADGIVERAVGAVRLDNAQVLAGLVPERLVVAHNVRVVQLGQDACLVQRGDAVALDENLLHHVLAARGQAAHQVHAALAALAALATAPALAAVLVAALLSST